MNRLKELRKKEKKKQSILASEIGVSEKTISRWENEESRIPADKAQALADHFGVSVGYLLGYTDIRTIAEEVDQQHQETLQQFDREIKGILETGYFLSDNDINAILTLLRTMSSSNNSYLWSLVEHKDKHISDVYKLDFSYFAERNPEYIQEIQKRYSDYLKRISVSDEEKELHSLRLQEIDNFRFNKK
ncbi:helix-turn-helix domain-containing protein [Streptococcus minor]|uniref:Helix-turn-helix domain-containing protein n=1 Tax=Streptococcus minor TaxID=229549 RepID=A0A3P1V6T6_9STRE|nr:helix-turn-helix domain-containing protein [Streptococcus minor]RRD29851.1 helix-turn-helix domain-containing protein [Streptococcus minor]